MKTLFKTYTNSHKAIAKRHQFEQKTGVKWQNYSTGDGMRFAPIATRETITNDELASILIKFCTTDYQGFVMLSEKSGLSIKETVSAAWTLIKNGTVFSTVCRMGGTCAIRLKQKWE